MLIRKSTHARVLREQSIAGKIAIPHGGKTPVSVALNVMISKSRRRLPLSGLSGHFDNLGGTAEIIRPYL